MVPSLDSLCFFSKPIGLLGFTQDVLSELLTNCLIVHRLTRHGALFHGQDMMGEQKMRLPKTNINTIRKLKINENERLRGCGEWGEAWAQCQAGSLLSAHWGGHSSGLHLFVCIPGLAPSGDLKLWPQTRLIMPHATEHYTEAFITIVTNWTINHSTPHPGLIHPTPPLLAKASSTVGDKRIATTRKNSVLWRTHSWERGKKKANDHHSCKTISCSFNRKGVLMYFQFLHMFRVKSRWFICVPDGTRLE